MAVRGFQQFWVAGAMLLIKKTSDTSDAWTDLGTMTSVSPQFENEQAILEDPRTGVKSKVFEVSTKFTETYEFTCANFAPTNLGIIFNSDDPETFSQAVTNPTAVSHVAKTGRIHKVKDSTGAFVYNLSSLIVTGAGDNIISITSGTKTFVVAGDQTAKYTVGSQFRLSGNSDAAANVTYTVASRSFSTNTSIVVTETVSGSVGNNGRIGKIYSPVTDYEVVDLVQGIFRVLSTGTIADASTVEVAYTTAVISSGSRVLYPQTGGGSVECDAIIIFQRDGGSEQTVRECTVSLSVSSLNISADEPSNYVFRASVLSDSASPSRPAGRLLQFAGDLPSAS